MLGLVKEISGQKTIIPLTTDTGTGAPVGTLISQYKKVPMSGYLYCDGSTFDETAYPALYLYLGTNVLPDYRECVMVGAEQNTTDTIAEHDVYTQGQFKDDQLQEHTHNIYNTNPGGTTPESPIEFTVDNGSMGFEQKIVGYTRNARAGDTTHGKQKAVYVYIKATSGLAENQQENVLNAVKDYTYSKYDTTANYQKTFTKVGNLGTYTRIVDVTAGTNLGYTEDLSNLFTNILSVQISCASYGGRYIDTYWQNTNDASLTIIYTATNDTRMCFQVTGVLKENYVEPF